MTWAVLSQAFGLVLDPYVLWVIFAAALFGLFVAYAISGYVLWAWRAMHGKPAIEKKQRENGGKAS